MFLLIAAGLAPEADSLMKREVMPSGTCSDGSRGHFYMEGNSSSSDYVVLLNGDEHLGNSPSMLTSDGFPDTIAGFGLLSGEEHENTLFSTYNRVSVPYCTSDMYLFDTESSDGSIQYRGRPLLEELLGVLLGNLTRNSTVVLAGSSAGGIGAFNVVGWLLDSFPMVTDLSVVLDSSLFFKAQENPQAIMEYFRGDPSSAYSSQCFEEFDGRPCCVQFGCMLLRGYYPRTDGRFRGTFAFQSLQDSYGAFLATQLGTYEVAGAKSLWDAAVYTGQMKTMLQTMTSLYPAEFSVFAPSCTDHVLITAGGASVPMCLPGFEEISPSGFEKTCHYDDRGYVSGVTFEAASGVGLRVRASWTSTGWETVKIDGSSARTALETWWDWRGDASKQVLMFDTCDDINCNPTCSTEVLPRTRAQTRSWLVWAVVLATLGAAVLVLAGGISALVWSSLLWRRVEAIDATIKTAVAPRNVVGQDGNPEAGPKGSPSTFLEWRGLSYWAPPAKQNRTLRAGSPSKDASMLGEKKILNSLHGSIPEGALCALMGPTGSGKSTLLSILTGRQEVGRCEGEILFEGTSVAGQQPSYIQNSGYMRQNVTAILDGLSVFENLVFAAMLRMPATLEAQTKRVHQVLKQTALVGMFHTKARSLSGGERRRLGLALELLADRRILFLDEPTSGLDATAALTMVTILKGLSQTITIIVAMHQPRPEVWDLFSHTIVLHGGKIAFCGQAERALHQVARYLPVSQAGDVSRSPRVLQASDNVQFSVPDKIMDMLAMIQPDDFTEYGLNGMSTFNNNRAGHVETPRRQHRKLETSDIPKRVSRNGGFGQGSTLTKMRTAASVCKVAAVLLARSVKAGYGTEMLGKLGILAGIMALLGLSLRVASDDMIMFHLIASTLLASIAPVMLTYQPVLTLRMWEDWSISKVELADGFYSPVCATVRVAIDHLAIGVLGSFTVVSIMHAVFWDVFISVLPTSGFEVNIQLSVGLTLTAWIMIALYDSTAISGLDLAHVLGGGVAFNTIWTAFSGTILLVTSLPAVLRALTYTSPHYWATGFMLRVLLDGLDMTGSCEFDSKLFCATSYGDLVAEGIDLHLRPTGSNAVVLAAFALVFMCVLAVVVQVKGAHPGILGGLG